MFAKKIQVAALSLALLVPAESALAEHHSQTRGALIGRGPRSALVGAAAGAGVQALRNHEENQSRHHVARHHRKHHRRHHTA